MIETRRRTFIIKVLFFINIIPPSCCIVRRKTLTSNVPKELYHTFVLCIKKNTIKKSKSYYFYSYEPVLVYFLTPNLNANILNINKINVKSGINT